MTRYQINQKYDNNTQIKIIVANLQDKIKNMTNTHNHDFEHDKITE